VWAAGLAAAGLVGGVALTQWKAPAAVAFRTIHTAPGERATVRLADGSVVVLGAHSTLRYSAQFGARDRDVQLDGEAYFTVAHHAGAPFSVYTRHAAARVLGTAFVVKAYATDAKTQIVIAEGRVALRQSSAPSSSGTTLVEGDLARIDSVGMITVTRGVAPAGYLDWTHGRLVFTDALLGDIIPELERWYDLDIRLADPALAKARITQTLDVESAGDAIASLEHISGFTWHRSGRVVTIGRDGTR
jgi:ferric-dicitrate binding protein FerR (iron transport regulator)